MDEEVIFRYKNGRIIPIKIAKEVTTNEYMNDKIRGKISGDVETNFSGHLEMKKNDYELTKDGFEKIKSDTYYQLDNGEKIEFLDKKEYKNMINKFYDSLTSEEKQALSIWIDDPSYMTSNPIFNYKKDYDKIMDGIFKDKAIVLDKDTLLFRRASDDYLDLKSGVNHKYAMSTSAYDTIPKTLPSGIKFGDKELYIIAPKGTKVLPIEKVAINDPSNSESEKRIYARQHELVLPKGTSYEVVNDLSTYYYRGPKGNEIREVPITEQRYVVKLTNKKYSKTNYEKPEYKFQWGQNGYGNYVYKHKGENIQIKEEYVGNWSTNRTPKSRQEVVKYRVQDLGYKGKKEYYDTYEEAIEAIKKYL